MASMKNSGRSRNQDDGEKELYLDILTKEEKEELLNKKMEEIRKKNKQLQKRHAEIQKDKQIAEQQGVAVSLKRPQDEESEPWTPPPHKPNNRGERPQRGPSRGNERRSGESDRGGRGGGGRGGVGRGQRLEQLSQQPRSAKGLEREMKPPPTGPDAPPPDPKFSFLADRLRDGQEEGRELPQDSNKQGRHPRNFGGQNLDSVKSKMKSQKERQSWMRDGSKEQMELAMTGKERRDYNDWKTERDRIDSQRMLRHRDAEGEWRREWDHHKVEQPDVPLPPVSRRQEPGKRPAGRIGSGRFSLNLEEHIRNAPSADDPNTPPQPWNPKSWDSRGPSGRANGQGREERRRVDDHDDGPSIRNDHAGGIDGHWRGGGRGGRRGGGRGGRNDRPRGDRGKGRERKARPHSDSFDVVKQSPLSADAPPFLPTRVVIESKDEEKEKKEEEKPKAQRTSTPRQKAAETETSNSGKATVVEDEDEDDQWEDAGDDEYFEDEEDDEFVEAILKQVKENKEKKRKEASLEAQDDNMHDSSSESFDRFIEEHTLRIDVDAAAAAAASKDKTSAPIMSPMSDDSFLRTPESGRVLDWAAEVPSLNSSIDSGAGESPTKKKSEVNDAVAVSIVQDDLASAQEVQKGGVQQDEEVEENTSVSVPATESVTLEVPVPVATEPEVTTPVAEASLKAEELAQEAPEAELVAASEPEPEIVEEPVVKVPEPEALETEQTSAVSEAAPEVPEPVSCDSDSPALNHLESVKEAPETAEETASKSAEEGSQVQNAVLKPQLPTSEVQDAPESAREVTEAAPEVPEAAPEVPEAAPEVPEAAPEVPEAACEAPEPVREAPEPVRKVPEPVREAVEAPEPGREAPEPVREAPEPVREAPEPVREAPEPVREAPEPVREAPEPVREAPEPVREAPEPVREVPEPVREAPEAGEASETVREAPETSGETPEAAREANEPAREAPEAAPKALETAPDASEIASETPEIASEAQASAASAAES